MEFTMNTHIRLILAALLSSFGLPAQAQVQAGCTGSNPGVVNCPGTADGGPSNVYSTGILHSATTGDLTVNSGNGITSYGTGGFVTTATGSHGIMMTKGTGNLATAVATGTNAPVVIGATSENGDISVTTAGSVAGVAATVQYGIRAQSTGFGDINISTSGAVSTGTGATNPGVAAIFAQSGGGDISILATGGNVSGRQYGIRAIAAGAGDITITNNNPVSVSTAAGVGIAAISATADTGNITLNVNGAMQAGRLISVTGNGLNTINVRNMIGGGAGAGTASSNLANAGGSHLLLSGAGQTVINLLSGTSYGSLYGGFDATANTGGVTVNNESQSGGWSLAESAVRFGAGSDVINNAGLIVAASGPGLLIQEHPFRSATMFFGSGQDSFNNAGTLLIGDAGLRFTEASTGIPDSFLGTVRPQHEGTVGSEVTLDGLEEFNNSGLIVLGGYVYTGGATVGVSAGFGPRFYTSDAVGDAYCRQVLSGRGLASPPPNGFPCTAASNVFDTDRLTSAVLSMPGTLFTGSEASAIILDVNLSLGAAQTNCQDRTGGVEVLHRLPGADCVDIRGGATAGSTQIIVRDVLPGNQGVPNADGIVIVDVGGGASAGEHFVLSADSDGYRETSGGRGVIDKGLFVFPLIYDESTQQHKLVGIAGASALQLPLLTHAAQSLARQTTASGLDERAQGVRSALRSGKAVGGGFWGELGQSTIERDLVQPVTAAGETFAFNNDYEQDGSTMILGGDWLIPRGDQTAWLLGGSIGYVRTELDFTTSGNRADLEGVAVGLHGGYQTGHWFVNAGYSQSFLQVDDYVSTFNLSTAGSAADTKAQTQSVRVDGGRRFSLTDALHVEPLVSVAWIRADFDDLVVASPDNTVAVSNTAKFGNAVSLRGALGARLGFDQALSKLRIGYTLTGRYWSEFEGKTEVSIQSPGPAVPVSNTFDGSFLDLAGRISVSDADGHISGYLDATSVSGDDYSSLGFSAGFRYQW